MRTRRTLFAGAAALLLAISSVATDTARAVPTEPSGPATESLRYLMTTYGVDLAEAQRRLDLQAAAPTLADSVRHAVGEELIEVRLDQAGGGKLVFLTSKPQQAQQALGQRFDAARMRIVHASKDVKTVDIAPRMSPTEQKDGGRSACTLACDTPMRGGVRLHVRRDPDRADGPWGSCTSGFNVRDSYGWVYVLTAGHCVINPGPKRQYLFHNGLPAVWEMNESGSAEDPNSKPDPRYAVNDWPGYDYAVLPYQTSGQMNWAGYWLYNRRQQNLVQSVCADTSYGCTTRTYPMVGMYTQSQMQPGWVVCATGTGTGAIYDSAKGYTSGTRCGEIGCTVMIDYTRCGGPAPNGYGIEVNICSRDGDSGGPLFSQIDNRAYGILSGGPAESGSCKRGEYSVYTPLSQIFDRFNRQTGRGLSLITG